MALKNSGDAFHIEILVFYLYPVPTVWKETLYKIVDKCKPHDQVVVIKSKWVLWAHIESNTRGVWWACNMQTGYCTFLLPITVQRHVVWNEMVCYGWDVRGEDTFDMRLFLYNVPPLKKECILEKIQNFSSETFFLKKERAHVRGPLQFNLFLLKHTPIHTHPFHYTILVSEKKRKEEQTTLPTTGPPQH